MARIGPKQILLILLALALLVTGLSFGSFYFPTEDLISRRGGSLSFIHRDYRLPLVDYRLPVGAMAGTVVVLLGGSWLTAELIARLWQRSRNRELAANAVLLRIAPRVDEKSKWEAAADMWAAIHSTLARPGKQVWLGAGLHASLEIVQQTGERITFYLWAPRPVAETLTRQLRATYSGLEIETLIKAGEAGTPTNQIDDYLDLFNGDNPKPALSEVEASKNQNLKWAWADLGTGRDAWRPLRIKFAADPLSSLLSTLEGLSPGNQLAAIHFILRPAADGWQTGGQAFIAKLRGDNVKQGKPRPKLGSQERDLMKQIEQKAQARGYDLCLRVLVAGQGDVDGNLERLTRVFDQLGADNILTVRAKGTQEELYRVKGRFLPAGWRNSVVSDLELAAMAHLPNQDISGIAITRARARLERPSPVSFVTPGEKRVVIGRFADVPSFGSELTEIEYPLSGLRRSLKLSSQNAANGNEPFEDLETERPVGIKLIDARRHFHVIGPTGVGKSTMLLRMIWQYLDQFPEAAVWLQEPHQDLTHKVIKRVPLWREKDIIWLDVMDPERAIGINPLDVPAEADVGAVVADVMGVIRKVMGASWETAVQMQEILNNALQAVLIGQPQPTFVHLFKLLSNADYRYDLTYNLKDPIAAPYWESLEMKKERELDQMFSVPRRRLNAFLSNPIVRRIVAQPTSTLDFRQAIDSGKVILVQLDGRMGGENRTFIGTLMMFKLFGSVMSRMDIPEEQRRQVAICVDEFQTFVAQSGAEFADILEQARKMGASLTLAHQHLGQLTQGGGDLISSVANNTGTKIVFRAEAADAPQFLKWLPELQKIEDLTTLANYRCYVRPMVNGSPQPVCTLYTYADPPIPDPEDELRSGKRGEPEPLPANPGQAALNELKRMRAMPSDEARKTYLKQLPEDGWASYLAARRYHDAVRRNMLIERPELIPDKLERVRALVRLGYGTPHYETEALVESVLES
jgi:hypothetical protein